MSILWCYYKVNTYQNKMVELVKKFQDNGCAIVRASGMTLPEILRDLKKANAVLPNPLDEAYFRILTHGKENIGAPLEEIRKYTRDSMHGEWFDYTTYGSYTNMGVEISKGKPPILTRKSKLLDILSTGLDEAVMQNLGFKWNWSKGYYSEVDFYEFSLREMKREVSKNNLDSDKGFFVLPGLKSFWITPKDNNRILNFLMGSYFHSIVPKYIKFCGNKPISFHIPYDAYEHLEEGQTRLGLIRFGVPHKDNLHDFGIGELKGVGGFYIEFFDTRDSSVRRWTRGISPLRTDDDKKIIDALPKIEGKEDRLPIYGNSGP